MSLVLGQRVETERCFLSEDVEALDGLTDAKSPDGHISDAFINGLFSYLLGVHLPGPGTNYLKQETRFLRQARRGEPVTARVEIMRLRPEKHLVDLATACIGANGDLIAEGRALVLAKDVAKAWD